MSASVSCAGGTLPSNSRGLRLVSVWTTHSHSSSVTHGEPGPGADIAALVGGCESVIAAQVECCVAGTVKDSRRTALRHRIATAPHMSEPSDFKMAVSLVRENGLKILRLRFRLIRPRQSTFETEGVKLSIYFALFFLGHGLRWFLILAGVSLEAWRMASWIRRRVTERWVAGFIWRWSREDGGHPADG